DASTFPSQLVWLAITFVLLYLALAKVALPRIAEVLDSRQRRISTDLEKAARLKGEAAQVLAGYEKALAEARTRAQAQIKAATDEVAADAARREAATAQRLAEQTKAAEARIGAAKQAALGNLRVIAAEVAGTAVERLIGGGVDRGQIDAAVAQAVKERG
ncbi:MAG: F0F1 ATP synthase subunit B', partial [Alphaproteobacteria bacterium]|nr:F0F1 ATP synthase subunit B' [Alphaproteobacteria bacterium]